MPGDESIPEHESAVRRMTADAQGTPYVAYKTLSEARADPDGAVVLESDYGGQILATAPANKVACSEQDLANLLADLDAIAWPTNEGTGAQVIFERRRANTGVSGGSGGGVVIDRPWVHPEFRALGLESAVSEVFAGTRPRITTLSRRQMAERYWSGGRPQNVGALIVPDLPQAARPAWASDVLAFMTRYSPQPSPVADQLIRAGRDERLWDGVPVLLEHLRQEAEKSGAPARQGFTWLLIDVASVVAAAAGYPNPSGGAAGWLIPTELHQMASELGDSILNEAWVVLIRPWHPSDE